MILCGLLVLLIGCSPRIIEIDRIEYVNQTKYVNVTTVIDNTIECAVCNTTPIIANNITVGNCSKRKIDLIQRIQWLESQQTEFINNSYCSYELNITKNKVKEMRNELCDWNISWC